ncbi:hypothetical protein BU14_0127s0025 [Porphyra umbilicalis]|uniref:Uncharacterized protein n=1 Tax=Porphyra umbilicalis TaxID=2786 RepID=A0A1X6PAQ8_PORUM|nr:hypothetical protein BU14_0127s0025 [Porphyra umbilicalis]|eukprot:OSX77927.1 hypothetical protein BU14_0127s0025 [Porphyra umbilicalis]
MAPTSTAVAAAAAAAVATVAAMATAVASPPPPPPPPHTHPRRPPGTAGAACGGSPTDCGALRCAQVFPPSGRPFPGVCVTEVAAGGACGTAGTECVFGLVCADGADDRVCGVGRQCPSGAGTCRPPAAGDACDEARGVGCSTDDSLVCAAADAPTVDAKVWACTPVIAPGGSCVAGAADGCGTFSRSLQRVCVGGVCRDAWTPVAGAKGDDCGGSVNCTGGTRCVAVGGAPNDGRCAAVATTAGVACNDAASETCDADAGLLCNERDWQCRVPRALGEPCARAVDNCDAFAARCVGGVCALSADRGVGDPCGPTDGGCTAGLACTGGTCVAAVGLGGACADGAQCVGSAAGPWTCATGPGAAGRTCRADGRLGDDCTGAGVLCGGASGAPLTCTPGGVCEVPAGTPLARRPCASDADCGGGEGGGGAWACRVDPFGDPEGAPVCLRPRGRGDACEADGDVCVGDGLLCLATSATSGNVCQTLSHGSLSALAVAHPSPAPLPPPRPSPPPVPDHPRDGPVCKATRGCPPSAPPPPPRRRPRRAAASPPPRVAAPLPPPAATPSAPTSAPPPRSRRRPALLTPFFARPTALLPRGWSAAPPSTAAATTAGAGAASAARGAAAVVAAAGRRRRHPPATPGQALAVHLLSGGLSAGLVRAALLPLDTAKTRLQAAARAGAVRGAGAAAAAAGSGGAAGGLRGAAAAGAGAGGAVLSAAAAGAPGRAAAASPLSRLAQSAATARGTALGGAGVRGLYRGLAPALAGVVPAAALYMGVYQTTKAALLPRFGAAWAPAAVALAAAIGDTAASLVRAPCELVKQRLQVGVYGGVGGAWTALRGKGLAAVYVGLPAQLARDIPFAASEFLVYEALQAREKRRADAGNAGGGGSGSAGGSAWGR